MSINIAILIPTKNRINYLLRTLAYYCNYNYQVCIYICDSSDHNYLNCVNIFENKNNRNKIPIYYFYKPNFNERQAIGFLLQKCKYKYCAFSGDDDIFVFKGLKTCSNFLENNPGYRVAQGRAVVFSFALHKKNVWERVREYWGNPSNEEANVRQRLENYSKRYWVPLFSVHRTFEFIADWKNNNSNPSASFGEYMPNFLTICAGKAKFINVPYLIRLDHQYRNILPKSAFDILTKDKWFEGYYLFTHNISLAMKKAGVPKKIVFNVAEELVKNLFNCWMASEYFLPRKKNILFYKLPPFTNSSIQYLIRIFIKIKRLIFFCSILKFKEFRIIINFIINYKKT